MPAAIGMALVVLAGLLVAVAAQGKRAHHKKPTRRAY